jgi:hypothetical protein
VPALAATTQKRTTDERNGMKRGFIRHPEPAIALIIAPSGVDTSCFL